MSKICVFSSRSAKEGDPLTRRILMAFRSLPERLLSFSVVCRNSDIENVELEYLRSPPFKFLDFLNYFFFQSHFFFRRLRKTSQLTVISGSPSTLSADMVLANFSHREYFRKVVTSRDLDLRERLKLGRVLWFCLFEEILLRFGRVKLILCNSPGLTEEFRGRCRGGTQVEYLPNIFSGGRFSPEVRSELRKKAREGLSLVDDEFVFSFLSYGHHLRKGFFVAARALALVNRRLSEEGGQTIRFLVIGGSESTIIRLKGRLKKIDSDFESWVIFSGSSSQPELLLSASDAFIFPSYFDSTPNAVIEAAGLGLPLFLTGFYGSEILLEDGVNGKLVSHDTQEMAETILGYLKSDGASNHRAIEPELLSEPLWAEEFFQYLDSVG